MTWSLHAAGAKEAVKTRIDEQVAAYQRHNGKAPAAAVAAASFVKDAIDDMDAPFVTVNATGHSDPNYGAANIEIRALNLIGVSLEAPIAEEAEPSAYVAETE
jgi:hypothetical protein